MPDTERMVYLMLDANPALAGRVVGDYSPDQRLPVVRVTRTGGMAVPNPGFMEQAGITLGVIAETKQGAYDTMEAAPSTLRGRGGERIVDGAETVGWLTSIETTGVPTWAPDANSGNPGYITEVLVFARDMAVP